MGGGAGQRGCFPGLGRTSIQVGAAWKVLVSFFLGGGGWNPCSSTES